LIEKKLIEECRDGDLNNFKRLLELTSPIAFQLALRMVGDEDQAKDIVQETLITIWQKIRKIKSVDGYNSWVYKIVVNKCYDHLRRRKKNPEFVADEKVWALISNKIYEGPSSELENIEIARIINLLTNKLSPQQKLVFVLSEIEQMSSENISEFTGMSRSGIKANLYYARKNIFEMIEKYIK